LQELQQENERIVFMLIALQNILMWKYAQNVDGIMISIKGKGYKFLLN
jgi:hypothetical protein